MELQEAITQAIRKYYENKENIFESYEQAKGPVKYTQDYFDDVEDKFLTKKEQDADEA